MSGESTGRACEVPTEPRDNTQVSIIQLFDMTIPFLAQMFATPNIRWWSRTNEIHGTADRAKLRVS
jgi:hypothetical protein